MDDCYAFGLEDTACMMIFVFFWGGMVAGVEVGNSKTLLNISVRSCAFLLFKFKRIDAHKLVHRNDIYHCFKSSCLGPMRNLSSSTLTISSHFN